MRNLRVYDLPTRAFHWIFAALFVVAFFIGKTVDDDSLTFSYHMLAGMTLSFAVILRIFWGFVGTTHARFSSFALNPADLLQYFKGILSGQGKVWAGHNPASSWVAILMFACALGLGFTGFQMASGGGEAFEEIHEILAHAFLVLAILHVLGVILHVMKHQDGLAMAMLNGQKNLAETSAAVASRPLVAVLFVAVIAGYAAYIFNQFDPQNRTLNLFGVHLQLGENEGAEGGGEEGEHESHSEADEED